MASEKQDLERIIERLQKFSDDRNWGDAHTPKNLALSIAVETGELLEHFQWQSDEEFAAYFESKGGNYFTEELADVLIYALNLARVLDIDAAQAINHKISVNELRFLPTGAEQPVGGA
jgi:dCTP diphosphatase